MRQWIKTLDNTLRNLSLAVYIFVGIQTGWVLRPFVGDPALPTSFFRKDAFTNSYVDIARILSGKLR